MDRESLPCPQPNMMFYFNPDTTVLSCQVIKADECLLQGGFTSMVDCQEKCLSKICFYLNNPTNFGLHNIFKIVINTPTVVHL